MCKFCWVTSMNPTSLKTGIQKLTDFKEKRNEAHVSEGVCRFWNDLKSLEVCDTRRFMLSFSSVTIHIICKCIMQRNFKIGSNFKSHVVYFQSLHIFQWCFRKHLLYRCNLQSRQVLNQVDQCTHLKNWLKNTKGQKISEVAFRKSHYLNLEIKVLGLRQIQKVIKCKIKN